MENANKENASLFLQCSAADAQREADYAWNRLKNEYQPNPYDNTATSTFSADLAIRASELKNLGARDRQSDAVPPLAQAYGYLAGNAHLPELSIELMTEGLLSLRNEKISQSDATAIANAWGYVGDNPRASQTALKPAGQEIQALWQHATQGNVRPPDEDLRKFSWAMSTLSKNSNLPSEGLHSLTQTVNALSQNEEFSENIKSYALVTCNNLIANPNTLKTDQPLLEKIRHRLKPVAQAQIPHSRATLPHDDLPPSYDSLFGRNPTAGPSVPSTTQSARYAHQAHTYQGPSSSPRGR